MNRVPAKVERHGRPVLHPGGTPVAAGRRITGPDAGSLRWLARHVLARDVAGLLLEVPTPQLVSAHLKRSSAVRDYVSWWIGHPEAGSSFEARTRWLRWLPGPWLVRALLALGYDGIVYAKGGAIVGHVFFQRRGTALHGFSTAVNEALDGEGYSVVMVLDYVAYGAQMPGITEVRVGTGRNNTTRRLLARIKKHEEQLGWRVGADGWVTFSPGAGSTP